MLIICDGCESAIESQIEGAKKTSPGNTPNDAPDTFALVDNNNNNTSARKISGFLFSLLQGIERECIHATTTTTDTDETHHRQRCAID